MIITDHTLAKRLEATEALLAAEYAGTRVRVFPQSRTEYLSVAGGVAVDDGPRSPITQAMGLGMSGPVEESEVDRLEDFYRERSQIVNVELCPHADESLRQSFARRGYYLTEQTNTLAQPLAPSSFEKRRVDGVEIRQAQPDEYQTLSNVVARGFLPPELIDRMWLDIFTTFSHQPSAQALIALVDGEMAGGGVVSVIDGVASLYATSTLDQFRGRGVQTALIYARLNYGVEHGCNLAMVSAAPGSVSIRNLQRFGFEIIYTRAKLTRAL